MTTGVAATTGQTGAGASSIDVAPALEAILSDLLKLDSVAPDAHFFDDLGADSLLMAHFCARVRKRTELPSISMQDVYRHPTIAGLTAQVTSGDGETVVVSDAPATTTVPQPSSRAVALCGGLQAMAVVAYALVAGTGFAWGYEWTSAGDGVAETYVRSVLAGIAMFFGLCALPIAAKWILIGRWKAEPIALWGLAYVRFWIVATLIRTNPMVVFVGTPLYSLYLRALGASIGRRVVILSRNVPVCTDLLTIGDDAVIRPAARFAGYRAHAGRIEFGAVVLGAGTFVGEASVLEIGTSMGDRSQLAHTSSLDVGQAVPAGERRHGSPAEPTYIDYRQVDPLPCGRARRIAYSIAQLVKVLAVQLPAVLGGLVALLAGVPFLAGLLTSDSVAITGWSFYLDALVTSVFVFGVIVIGGLLVVTTIPRLLNLALVPDRVYPMYGVHYGIHRAVARLTNLPFFTYLFGDSAGIVHYLRSIGYRLTPVEQTGSNFGLETRHENPFLSSFGTGTMVADGMAILNADYSSSSFRLSRTRVGSHNFLGNYVTYPPQGRTGDDCLLATKVMVPIDGQVREGVGLLGSPSFEIPRSVHRDSRLDHFRSGPGFRERLAAKTRHNTGTMARFLLLRWVQLLGVTTIMLAALDFYGALGGVAIGLASVLALLSSIAVQILAERIAAGFRSLQPQYCSIYQAYFWWHERYWKLSPQLLILNGTPFKTLGWRLLGVRIGARVFDDGAAMNEKTLITVGDDCVFNAGSIIQPHSQEDGAFKSDRITIGSGCTVGVGALVHYGVTMGDRATLAADSFLMKGEDVPAQTRWGGNPAKPISAGQRSGT
jgi:non-ribosomal peptide synthetase-like protein